MEPTPWTDVILGATLVEIGVRIVCFVLGSVLTVLGFWGLRRRIKALENSSQSPQPVVQQTIYVGQHSIGPERPISSTTIDRIEAMPHAEYVALPHKDERTLYLFTK